MARRSAPVEVRKENLFLRVKMNDELTFEDVTRFVGKKAPYPKFSSIASARVSDKIVSFTVQQIPNRLLSRRREEDLAIPRSPLSFLEATALQMMEADSLPQGVLAVIRDGVRTDFTMDLSDSGVLALAPVPAETPEGQEPEAGEDAEEAFEIPKRPLRFDLFFRSPKVDRVLAVHFNGHMDRAAGELETLHRVVLKALHSLIPLANFQMLAGIQSTEQPSPPAAAPVAPAAWSGGDVEFTVPAWLYAADNNTAVEGGYLKVVIDLEHANNATGRLLFSITPDEKLAPHFEAYTAIASRAVDELIAQRVPVNDQQEIGYDIVLGDVSDSTVERLREDLGDVAATLLLTPTLHQVQAAQPAADTAAE